MRLRMMMRIMTMMGMLLLTGFWIWMLVDCVKFETPKGNARTMWSIVIAVTHVIGALIYFFFRKVPRAS